MVAGPEQGMAQVRQDSPRLTPAQPDTLPRLHKLPSISQPFPDMPPMLFYIQLPQEQTYVQRDSLGSYNSQRLLFEMPVASSVRMSFDHYAEESKQRHLKNNWQQLIQEQQTEDRRKEGLLDFNLDIPGERNLPLRLFLASRKLT